MDWQEKAAALDALAEIEIKIRKPGDWYVSQRVEIKNDGVLECAYGNGATPEEAIEDHWRVLVKEVAQRHLYLIARAYTGDRRAVRWNGFMWQDVPEPKRAEQPPALSPTRSAADLDGSRSAPTTEV